MSRVAAWLLRPATPSDRVRLEAICAACSAAQPPPGAEVWVAARGSEVAGFVELGPGRVLGPCVAPGESGSGLDAQLLRLAELQLQDRGYTEVRCDPRPGTERLFLERGYRPAAADASVFHKALRGATSFDEVAALYHEARPGYPEALFDELVAFAGLGAGARILEVGCGTGKATLPLARRGFAITCLEPGANLAAIARRECAALPKVEIAIARFEDWPLERAAFDLVISAQAFHWVDPETGYARAGQALRPGGTLALFWNQPFPGMTADVRLALDRVYRERAPQIATAEAPRGLADSFERQIQQRIGATGAFGPVEVRSYPWSTRYDAEQYLRLLRTHSDHATLEADTRAALFDGIRQVLEAAGDEVEVESRTLLLRARHL